MRQTLNQREVQHADLGIHLSSDDQVISASSSFVPGLSGDGQSELPFLSVLDAALATASHLEIALPYGPYLVSPVDEEGEADSWLLDISSLSLDPIEANLHYVPTAEGHVELAWKLIVRSPDGDHWYDLSVDASDGTMLRQSDWIAHASYDVFPIPMESPLDGPSQIVVDPHLASPSASPFGWHDTNGIAGAESTLTIGNNVDAHLDRDGNNVADLNSRPDGGAGLNFNVAFDPAKTPLENANAAVTNLFYWNNVLHDVHYQYGFTPVAGNFQTNNYGLGGLGNDAVQADAQDNADGGSSNNANFGTPPDGSAPRMQMFEFTSTTPRRDSDMDAGIIVHEYGHGVSNRLTGGPSNASALSATQSGGMGEGWSDWWSLMFRQKSAADTTTARGAGMYVLGQTLTGAGIRNYRYDFDIANPSLETFLHFGTGTGQSTAVHAAGTRWASTLWDLNHLLINKYGYEPNLYNSASSSAGNILAMHLVTDGLKLQPANPSFLQARDAILAADTARTGGANHFEIWTAFARRGLGVNASTASSTATVLTTSFEIPAGVGQIQVTTVVPSVNSTVSVPPTDFVVNFNQNYFADSVSASDFSVNAIAATSFTLLDPDSIAFQFGVSPVSSEGLQTMAIAADAILKADGTSGNLGFSGNFRFDSVPLQVTSVSPSDTSVVVLSGSLFVDIDFNEPLATQSVSNDDLSVNLGSVTASQLLDADTVRYTIDQISSQGTLTVTLNAGKVADTFSNPLALPVVLNYQLDIAQIPFPGLFETVAPNFSLVHSSIVNGALFSGDTDQYLLGLESDQTVTVVATPISPSLRLSAELFDPIANTVYTQSASSAGQAVIIQTVPTNQTGSYPLTIRSLDGTSGSFSIQVILNSASEEEETLPGKLNNTLATAQDINPSTITLGSGLTQGRRSAVLGKLGVGESQNPHVNFENGLLPSSIVVASYTNAGLPDPLGRIRVKIPDGTGNTSSYALMMDREPSGDYTLNEAIWTVPIASVPSATLSFTHIQISDEAHPLPDSFVGRANGDGVAISPDGLTWYTILNSPTNTTWTKHSLELVGFAASKGFSLGSTVQIKFQQYDNFPLTTDGRGYDDLTLDLSASHDFYRLSFTEPESVSIGIQSLGVQTANVSLLSSAGTLLATSSAIATNVRESIKGYSITAPGDYYLRVFGSTGSSYNLSVFSSSGFESENNSTSTLAELVPDRALIVGSIDNDSGTSSTSRAIEDFEAGPSGLSKYTFTSTHLASVNSIDAHDGSFGMGLGAGTSNWFYRNDAESQVKRGDIISYWVRTSASPTGRIYLGFGASATGSLSLVLGGNTSGFMIQNNAGYLFNIIGSVPQTYTANTWYRCEVDWKETGEIVGRLFGSNGTTLINTVTALRTTISGGGLSFRNIIAAASIDSISVTSSAKDREDWFAVDIARPNDQLRIETGTPFAGSGAPDNLLDPTIEVYSPSDQLVAVGIPLPDDRNEKIQLTELPVAGRYRVRVRGNGTAGGQYELSVANSKMLQLSSSVVSENLPRGTTVGLLDFDGYDYVSPVIYSFANGDGDEDNSAFTVYGNILKTNEIFDYETKSNYSIRLQMSDSNGYSFERNFNIDVTDIGEPRVVSRQLFYNRSTSSIFGNGTGNPINAIDPTKIALLPGQTVNATANYSNYSLGLNGIVIDIANPTNLSGIGASSFQFATWNDFQSTVPEFVATNPTVTVTTYPSGGLNGSDRVKLEFNDNAIQDAWLRVTMLHDLNTGLEADDVFYFGNARFDVTPSSPFPSQQVAVNAFDVNAIRARQGQTSGVVSNVFDVDRSGVVNAFDTNGVRSGLGVLSLRAFTAPAASSFGLTALSRGASASNVDLAVADISWSEGYQNSREKNRRTRRF